VDELSVLHGLCDKGKELLKVKPTTSYSGKNESGDEAEVVSFKQLFSRVQFTIGEQN